MGRRSALLAVSCAIAALAVPAATAARTRVHHFTPFDAVGQLKSGYRASHSAGSCPQPSFVDSLRHDSWRCNTGNLIRDPCFESPVSDTELVCVTSPWTNKALVVRVLLPARKGESRSSAPWALQLASRRRCVFVSGGTNTIGRKRLNYVCGRHGPVLYGVPDRRRSTWTISLAAGFKSRSLRRVGVREAWR
jgi:hypothetical protein